MPQPEPQPEQQPELRPAVVVFELLRLFEPASVPVLLACPEQTVSGLELERPDAVPDDRAICYHWPRP